MPTNLLKIYNQLLELDSLDVHRRIASLKGVFKRDFVDNTYLSFRKKKLHPTPAEGEDTMERGHTFGTKMKIMWLFLSLCAG